MIVAELVEEGEPVPPDAVISTNRSCRHRIGQSNGDCYAG